MKKLLCALLALALCLPVALAEGDGPVEAPPVEQTEAPKPVATPEPEPDPTAAPAPEPEQPQAPEATQVPEDGPDETAPGGDVPAGDEPVVDGPIVDEPTVDEPAGDAPETLEGPGLDGPALFSAPEPNEAAREGYLDGQKDAPGALKDLLATPGEKTVYVLSAEPVSIPDFPLALLRDVTLLPDPETFPGDYIVTRKNGDAEIADEDVENATADQTVELVIAVEKKPEDPPTDPNPPSGGEEVKLEVVSPDYAEGVWVNSAEFHLAGKPEEGGYSYVALIYGDRFVPMLGDVYVPEEGEYTLRFAILDARGDVVDASREYPLMLDCTPPMLAIEVSQAQDYTMTLSGYDALSGVVELSLDGGETWTSAALGEGLSVVHTEARKKTFPPEMIRVRDQAGNESWNVDEIVLDKLAPAAPMGWGGGGGGGDPEPTAAPHASGDGDDAPYDAYELALPEGPVEALTLGGEAIDLELAVEGAPAPFTAELTSWAVEQPVAPEIQPQDTLVIRADAPAPGDGAYTWRINGAVLRKLYNSDIAYLALAAGDAVLGLPTVGFTAGTRYAQLKMEGVSTAEFEYEIVMHLDPGALVDPVPGDWNQARDCSVEIWVEVNGDRFAMIDRLSTPEMYPFDVSCGPSDLPDYPFGAYPGQEG